MRGKPKESPALKNLFDAYLKLSDKDKENFRSKVFSNMTRCLPKNVRDSLKLERKKLLAEIESQQNAKSQVVELSKLPREVLEAALKAAQKSRR